MPTSPEPDERVNPYEGHDGSDTPVSGFGIVRAEPPLGEPDWVAMTDAMILRSLTARYLDDDGDGYGGIPFISLNEAIRALTTDREHYAAAALRGGSPDAK